MYRYHGDFTQRCELYQGIVSEQVLFVDALLLVIFLTLFAERVLPDHAEGRVTLSSF